MKRLAIAATLLYSSSTLAAATLSWVPGDVVEGALVTEWIIKCGPESDPYSNPVRLPFLVRKYVMNNLPDGAYKCKARAYSSESETESEDSNIVSFVTKDGNVYTGVPGPSAIPLPPILNDARNL